ncbi:MAG: hypothetical protein H7A36_03930 [Chlamydiales bacterium]|nr:hypothetical protein [Chlamydiales bacterium]
MSIHGPSSNDPQKMHFQPEKMHIEPAKMQPPTQKEINKVLSELKEIESEFPQVIKDYNNGDIGPSVKLMKHLQAFLKNPENEGVVAWKASSQGWPPTQEGSYGHVIPGWETTWNSLEGTVAGFLSNPKGMYGELMITHEVFPTLPNFFSDQGPNYKP